MGPFPNATVNAEPRIVPALLVVVATQRIRDATGHGLGVIAESSDRKRFVNRVLVPRNTKVPAQGEKQYQIQVGPGREAECTVYVTEGEGEDPQRVAVRER